MAQMMQVNYLFYPFFRLLGPSGDSHLSEIFLFILGTVPIWFMIIDSFRGPTTALRVAVDNSKGYDFLLPDFIPFFLQFFLQFYYCQTIGILLNIFAGFIAYVIWNLVGLPTWNYTGLVMGNKLSEIKLPIFATPSDSRLVCLTLCTLVSVIIRVLQISNPFYKEIKHNQLFAFIVLMFIGWLVVLVYEKSSEKKLVFYLGILTMNLAPLIMVIVPISKNPITENSGDISNHIKCLVMEQNSRPFYKEETSPKEPNRKPKKQKRRKRQDLYL